MKHKKCGACNSEDIVETYICDSCRQDMLGVPIEISFGYGHCLDEITAHFCSDSCLMKFLIEEWRKNKPEDNRFEYGGNK